MHHFPSVCIKNIYISFYATVFVLWITVFSVFSFIYFYFIAFCCICYFVVAVVAAAAALFCCFYHYVLFLFCSLFFHVLFIYSFFYTSFFFLCLFLYFFLCFEVPRLLTSLVLPYFGILVLFCENELFLAETRKFGVILLMILCHEI